MAALELCKKDLDNLITLHFETIDKDDLRCAEVYLNPRGFYTVWFNGKIIYSVRLYSALVKRFNVLHENWKLEKVNY